MLKTIVTFLPSTMKVFFCRFGLKTRLVRRREKLTLLPNCFPFPVSSQRDVIILLSFLNNPYNYSEKVRKSQGGSTLEVKGCSSCRFSVIIDR